MSPEGKKLVIDQYVKGNADELIYKYILNGPTVLKELMKIKEEEWRVVFDYLVFEKNLLYKCVADNRDFFIEKYIKFGTSHVRDVLDILDEKYDSIWEVLFDFIAISNDGLYYHVLEHRNRYISALKTRGADFVRKVLGISSSKYAESWGMVLDFLLHSVCDDIFSEQTFEHSLKAFSMITNGAREYRPICKSGLI
jgi:hypothetical protein